MEHISTVKAEPVLQNPGLDPYEGPWGMEQAAHLLRRTTFGPTFQQIKDASRMGLDAVIEQLFAELPLPKRLPINYEFEKDPLVPIGETWLDKPYSDEADTRVYRRASLNSWTIQQLLEEGISIREKMVLFWHNHFVTAIQTVKDPRFMYQYITLFRNNPWGSFKKLVQKVTINPAMLRYLNGNQNKETAPNENYARELLELFTIGKGPFAGPGDYTHYTEQDVVEIARALTGWKDRGYYTSDPNVEIESYYLSGRHDKTNKQLSHRFNDAVITNTHGQEYRQVINVIFRQDEVSRFISRKLYRWFVYYKIDEQTEREVIEPMAQILRDNSHEIRPALAALLGSRHFFESRARGPMIKNPIDYLISSLKQLEIAFPSDIQDYYKISRKLFLQLPVVADGILQPAFRGRLEGLLPRPSLLPDLDPIR